MAVDPASAESGWSSPAPFAGLKVLFIGKLSGMNRHDAGQLVRDQGGQLATKFDATVNLLVISEAALPPETAGSLIDALEPAPRAAVQRGAAQAWTETEFWQRLGLVDTEQHIHRLYTPAMLAEMLKVPLAVIRRLHRRGLIQPAREVRRLPYFDFQEVLTARRLAELLTAGVSPQALERHVAALRKLLPQVDRPLSELSVLIEGKQLLLRQESGLLEPGGQYRFDFDAAEPAPADTNPLLESAALELEAADSQASIPLVGSHVYTAAEASPVTLGMAAGDLAAQAMELEDAGELAGAAELYRAALAAGGPDPQLCFSLAETLYRLGDLQAARERYYMAIEIDENYVEARANLGCVLAELNDAELAIAAFEGALRFHPDYPDARYHLAQLLDQLERRPAAEPHWRAFLALAPDSPWADYARQRLGIESDADCTAPE